MMRSTNERSHHTNRKLIMNVMKLTFLLLTVALLTVQAHTAAQTITLSGKNISLERVVSQIEKQTGYTVFTTRKLLAGAKPVSVQVHNMPLVDFLDLSLKDQPLKYQISGKTISLTRRDTVPKESKQERSGGVRDSSINSITLTGQVRAASTQSPLPGVTVLLKGTKRGTTTDADGRFRLDGVSSSAVLQLRMLGYELLDIAVGANNNFDVVMKESALEMEGVTILSTGFQDIPKERATGSFEFVNNKLVNRKVSTDFASRLHDIVPGISSYKETPRSRNTLLGVNIRGRSSLKSNYWPLVVLDGIPYEGDYNNINPNDIESMTILKDAAAASVWGAKSGNGVIVINTKKGRYNSGFNLSVNTNLTIESKPDLYSLSQMSASDYIDLELELYNLGRYEWSLDAYYSDKTPVIQLLKKFRDGEISQDKLDNGINRLRTIDGRDDFLKYVYRKAIKQQHNIQLSSGNDKMAYNLSIGFDDNKNKLVTSDYDRLTIRNALMLKPVKRLNMDFTMQYTSAKTRETAQEIEYNYLSNGYGTLPYLELADQQGNALAVHQATYGWDPIFRDTIAGGRLLNWEYKPLDELYATSFIAKERQIMLNATISYQLFPWLKSAAIYGYSFSNNQAERWEGIASYSMRSSLNWFASWDDKNVYWGIPVGDKLGIANKNNQNHNARLQFEVDKTIADKHQINALIGAELRENIYSGYNTLFWGYNKDNLSYADVDYTSLKPNLNGMNNSFIDHGSPLMEQLKNRYLSSFANVSYSYNRKYIVSGSARRDASNLFGVKPNNRAKPFWSAGLAWVISNEDFYQSNKVHSLKLRATYGYTGNVNNTTSAYPIMNRSGDLHTTTQLSYATIVSPPNPSLRWEKVSNLNLGTDFAAFDNRISGSIEYYIKNPKDLVYSTLLDPTTGFTNMNINGTSMQTKGWDISLNTVNIRSKTFQWSSHLIFSYSKTRITKAYVNNFLGKNYPAGVITPFAGMDAYSVLSFPSAGLDPATGAARGYVDGEVSMDYAAIYNGTTVYQMNNNGPKFAPYFGGFRNAFQYKNWELSFNIAYQLGHKFIRGNMFTGYNFVEYGIGSPDYAKRWRKPGDEATTDIPSFRYPADYYESMFYSNSSSLVESASQIKLRDIQFSLTLPMKTMGIKQARFYGYVNNLGTIWKATKAYTDPEYHYMVPADPLAFSLGLNVNF
ncbi:SusC/RagA family TonB-linked outer membrane protein [Chitinophaga defluvii]|uniref:SusC/RagA family TonB-linked outer membrane protein n=1 Tax=Chitinophaga defluvii TaxID=3163343 RepID=A0ABV2TBB8_9BACT